MDVPAGRWHPNEIGGVDETPTGNAPVHHVFGGITVDHTYPRWREIPVLLLAPTLFGQLAPVVTESHVPVESGGVRLASTAESA